MNAKQRDSSYGPAVLDPLPTLQSAAGLLTGVKGGYWWEEMPPSGRTFFQAGSVASPAYGTQVVVTSYQCPSGFVGVLKGILNVFDGALFVPGSGSAFWTIDIDTPIPLVGVAGYAFEGYAQLLTPMGGYANGLWRIYDGLKFGDGQTIRYKFQTVNTVGQGAPNFSTCMLAGWIVPAQLAQSY